MPDSPMLPTQEMDAQLDLCVKIQKGLREFFDTSEIGERGLLMTEPFVRPVISSWKRTTRGLRLKMEELVEAGEIPVDAPVTSGITELDATADYYVDTLDLVKDDDQDVQRDIIFRFILSPLLYGAGYEIYFDEESPWVTVTPGYCNTALQMSWLRSTIDYVDLLDAMEADFLGTIIKRTEGVRVAKKSVAISKSALKDLYRKTMKPAAKAADILAGAAQDLLDVGGGLLAGGLVLGLIWAFNK